MKNNDGRIPELYTLLAEELEKRGPYLSPRTRCEWDRRRRQGPAFKTARYFIAVLENHILDRTVSVVFTIEIAEDCALRFYRPLTAKEYGRLAASGYAPVLRSGIFLSVGLGQSGVVPYAYSEVKLSQYAGVIDLFDALPLLGGELEKFLTQ